MSHRLRRAAGIGVVLVAALAVGLPALADRAPRSQPAVAVVSHRAAQPAAHYWTPERLRAAVPADLLSDPVGELTRNVMSLMSTGAPPVARPRAARPSVVSSPVPAVGRVFFSLPDADYTCTGTLVQAANRDTVVTAGHCVWGSGGWASNWVFVPGYQDGNEPYGEYPARTLYTTGAFQQREDISVDVAFATLVTTEDGWHLADLITPEAIGFNMPRHQYLTAFGYPTGSPYDGSSLVACAGYVHDDNIGRTYDQGLDRCTMTEGASGGPWFQGWDGTRGMVTSVTSVGYDQAPDVLWGPYFGEIIRRLYLSAQGS